MPRVPTVTCFFCNLAFNSKELHAAHMKQSHFQCSKCQFWLATELYQYDHTCIPQKQHTEPPCSMVIEPIDEETETEQKQHTIDYTESVEFRWQKCATHATTVCKREELNSCEACRLMRFKMNNRSNNRINKIKRLRKNKK